MALIHSPYNHSITSHPSQFYWSFSQDMDDQALISSESLDRASPELWPEQSIFHPFILYFRNIPGVSEFISTRQPDLNIQTPAKYTTDLDKEDLELIHGIENFDDFGSLSTQQLMDKIKQLQNLAYQVGLEESKEMSRGKFLNILGKR
ncbi:unnamed protein product [Dibothriocephalus latus]|uniref:Protein lin-52 homolog n=1 Tax=Dibothriocephalus latus TaxID=60516 RepID=A0A3P7LSL7_DIBLA|nr:unnamed protein product [Dibothriocephalus latus]